SKLQGERANNAWVKNQNLNLILNLIRELTPVSRAEISKRTGLSRSTVSQLVSCLIETGMIEETGSGESIGGRRPILLQIKPESRLICAVHVDDGGQIQAVAEDLLGNEVNHSSAVVVNAEDLVPTLIQLINALTREENERVASIVLALPGIISSDGTILSAVNLGWKSVPVSLELAKVFSAPILAENATGLAAFGEFDIRGLDKHNLVYLRIGSAVGAGIVANNQLHQGLRGSEAEIGHMVIDLQGKLCKCGRRGCLETKVSRAAVYELVMNSYARSDLEALKINENNVFEWLVMQDKDGQPLAGEILRTIARYVAVCIINVLNLMGTDAFFIESRLCDSRTFWETLNETISNEALPFAHGEFELMRSILGENAILKGATAYGRRHFFAESRLLIDNIETKGGR
ncbi:MAG: ROK family transcriptional regulator, partial [Bacillota bacterium]